MQPHHICHQDLKGCSDLPVSFFLLLFVVSDAKLQSKLQFLHALNVTAAGAMSHVGTSRAVLQ